MRPHGETVSTHPKAADEADVLTYLDAAYAIKSRAMMVEGTSDW
jgi:hypothetical protein